MSQPQPILPIAVVGRVGFLLFHSHAVTLPFLVASLALLLYHSPRISPLRPAPSLVELARRPDPIV